MTLRELCQPFFLYVCRLNRSARKGGGHDHNHIRRELKALLEDMKSNAAVDVGLLSQYEKIEEVLIFFADSMIAESTLPFAREWHEDRLAYERKELAGDEKFFDLLDKTLEDPSEAATERLAVFYTCMGLGFTGFYAGQPEYLRRKMLDCKARILDMMDADQFAKTCPEAYKHVDTRDLIEPPRWKLQGIALALVSSIIVLFVISLLLFKTAGNKLGNALNTINRPQKAGHEAKTSE
ncbi:DotU family type IV/VI secretion system protein [bacterium]|nr:DotU family type IV/VI secretion system protein [bacterium]